MNNSPMHMDPTSREGAAASFIRGAGDPWRGLFFLLSHPRLWPLAALPFVLSLTFYILMIGLGWHWYHGWAEELFLGRESAWWAALRWLMAVIFWIVSLMLSAVAFIPLAAVISSPFNDLLSEKTERLYRNTGVDEPFSIRLLLRGLRISLLSELARLAYLAVLLAMAMLLHFLPPPVGSALAAAAAVAITIHFISLEFTSYSMDRRLYRWNQKKAYLSRNRARTLGFGAMAFLIMLVPLVNAFFIPVSAVAGTMLFCDTELGDS